MELESTFNAIESTVKRTANITPDDYIGEDNLYHCGKCGTRKQTVINVFGGDRVVPCICECQAAKMKADAERQELFETVMRLRNVGFPEQSMLDWTFANDDNSNPQLSTAMKNYVDNFATFKADGKGLLLFGNVGTGKTFFAACIANALIDKGVPCLMTNFARIANEVQERYDRRQQYYDNLNSYPLLVIDDLSAERKTEYMQEIVFNVIDARYRAKLPLIVTTNLTREELQKPSDLTYKRIFSRLFEMCTPIEVNGRDRRKQVLRDDIGKYKDLLGL